MPVVAIGGAVAGWFGATAVSTVVAGAIGGAIVGAVVGGVTAAINGGNVGKGILMGAATGAVTGAFAGYMQGGAQGMVSTGNATTESGQAIKAGTTLTETTADSGHWATSSETFHIEGGSVAGDELTAGALKDANTGKVTGQVSATDTMDATQKANVTSANARAAESAKAWSAGESATVEMVSETLKGASQALLTDPGSDVSDATAQEIAYKKERLIRLSEDMGQSQRRDVQDINYTTDQGAVVQPGISTIAKPTIATPQASVLAAQPVAGAANITQGGSVLNQQPAVPQTGGR